MAEDPMRAQMCSISDQARARLIAMREGSTLPPPPDRDSDGVSDGQDNYPDIANPDQADADNDGKGDVCDHDDEGGGIDPVLIDRLRELAEDAAAMAAVARVIENAAPAAATEASDIVKELGGD